MGSLVDTLPSDALSAPLAAPANAPDADGPPAWPTLAQQWGAGGLVASILDNRAPLLRCEDAGLGSWLDNVLGGGLQSGETFALGAAGAGVGKTALVHQLGDGWAGWSARNIEQAAGSDRRPEVVPIIYVTEMSARALTIRSLARTAAVPGNLLRAPGHFGTAGEEAVKRALVASVQLLPAANLITPVDRTVTLAPGVGAVEALRGALARSRERWTHTADIRAAVLVIDPIHRLLDAGKDETQALSDVLGALLRITQQEGFVTILTSDTTKSAAAARSGDSKKENGAPAPDDIEAQAEQAFRGSYQLMHVPDHVLMLRALDPQTRGELIDKSSVGRTFRNGRGETQDSWATVFADLPSPKLRWGKVGDRPAFWYDRALFRFVPIDRPVVREHSAPARGVIG